MNGKLFQRGMNEGTAKKEREEIMNLIFFVSTRRVCCVHPL